MKSSSELDDQIIIMATGMTKRSSSNEMMSIVPSPSSSTVSNKFRAEKNVSLLAAFSRSEMKTTMNTPHSPCSSKATAETLRFLDEGRFRPSFPSLCHQEQGGSVTPRLAYGAASIGPAASSSIQDATSTWQEDPEQEPSHYVIKFPASRSTSGSPCYYEVDQKNRTMMVEELRLICILRHEHIVQLHHLSSTPSECERPFVVLDRLAAETLEDILTPRYLWSSSRRGNNENNDLRSRLRVVRSLASVMDYLHEKRIIYRGLEPATIGFEPSPSKNIKLFSFASARELPSTPVGPSLCDHSDFNLTAMVGAPNYMAPENCLGQPYGPSADVYSFSIVAWEILSQKRAFVSFTSTTIGVVSTPTTTNSSLVAAAARVQPQQERPEMNKAWPLLIRNILRFGWARRNATRPSMKVVVAALDQYLDGKSAPSPAIAQYINVMLLSNVCFMEW